jgi:hypothetical protein
VSLSPVSGVGVKNPSGYPIRNRLKNRLGMDRPQEGLKYLWIDLDILNGKE